MKGRSMASTTATDPHPGDAAGYIDRWARAMCRAQTNLPPDICATLGIDVADVRRLGSQLICVPPPGTSHLELIVGLDSDDVAFAEFTPSETLTVDDLIGLFGDGHEAPPGP